MITETIDANSVTDVSTLTADKDVVIHNLGNHPVYLVRATTTPSVDSYGMLCLPQTNIAVNLDIDENLYIVAEQSTIIGVEEIFSASGEHVVATLPESLFTSGSEGTRRLRVDDSQTSFFLGTQARTFKELNIPNGTSYVVKVQVNVNTVLFGVDLSIDEGSVRLTTLAGGTPSGTFSETLPTLRKNYMTSTPAYAVQNVLTAGGSVSGGTTIDIARVAAGTATAHKSSVGSQAYSERGVAPGTYYWKFENIGSGGVTGTFSAFWEERP